MELPRNEIAFRKEYECLVLDHAITTIFRPGNRVFPNWRGYKPGELVTARIIEVPGCDDLEIPPTFNEHKTRVQIASIETKNINALTEADFEGSSADVYDIESLKAHLLHIYQRPVETYDNLITRIRLAYVN